MKIQINDDEWYPVYSFETDKEGFIGKSNIFQIDDKTVERWEKVFSDFDRIQSELLNIVTDKNNEK